MEIQKEKFLNIEEADNLQDMINFAASMNISNNLNEADLNKTRMIIPIETLFSQVEAQTPSGANDKTKDYIEEILNRYCYFKIH